MKRTILISLAHVFIVNLVQTLSEELILENVRLNAINPERMDTPMRSENFGLEPKETLLDSIKVMEIFLQTLLTHIIGQIIDVRKNQQHFNKNSIMDI